MVTLAYLTAIEAVLRQRHGDDQRFRLSYYFDLIEGTSTRAIIAAALARGMSVAEITQKHLELGQKVSRKVGFVSGW
jgi:patatin-like phospholipase/acyl hydrolase